MKFTAIYIRVSSKQQQHRSQLPDLQRWANAQAGPVRWFKDSCTGKNMDRPAWRKLEEAMRAGKVSAVVCWRLDRLGRTASGLTALFEELIQRKVNLVSLRDGVDLSTPAGRLMAQILASIAEYETELRGERVRAGQIAARKAGKRWGGSTKGRRWKVNAIKVKAIRQLRKQGEPIAAIARAVGVSRPSVYATLATGK